jgi:hypothetical protein
MQTTKSFLDSKYLDTIILLDELKSEFNKNYVFKGLEISVESKIVEYNYESEIYYYLKIIENNETKCFTILEDYMGDWRIDAKTENELVSILKKINKKHLQKIINDSIEEINDLEYSSDNVLAITVCEELGFDPNVEFILVAEHKGKIYVSFTVGKPEEIKSLYQKVKLSNKYLLSQRFNEIN